MAVSVSSESSAARTPRIPREEYAAFINQIELTRIWLQEAQVINHHGPQTPRKATFSFSSDVGWEVHPLGFRAFDRAKVVLKSSDAVYAEFEVTFGLEFASAEPMTDQIFDIFGEINLPVNTWPYLREFISTTLGRMGWAPFTLPALKRGTGAAKRRATRRSPRKSAEPPTKIE